MKYFPRSVCHCDVTKSKRFKEKLRKNLFAKLFRCECLSGKNKISNFAPAFPFKQDFPVWEKQVLTH